ncbi:MAG: MFS transporter [Burkholderiales bacterium]|nr:MFS transporter [Burkholderiales bacterium]
MTQSLSHLTPARERLLLFALAGVQFSHILDFMLVMPLGPQLMRHFDITPTQFGLLVTAYTLAASVVGFASALVIDRFDRRHTLLALFGCFTLATLVTATAQSYAWLLVARSLSGAFAGVLGASVFAIVGDVVPERRRGAALGLVMSAFSVASIAGVPISLALAARFGWRSPFFFMTALTTIVLVAAWAAVPSVGAHLDAARARNPLAQVRAVLGEANLRRAFMFSAMLTFSGFAVIPFVSPYMVANVGVSESELAYLYLAGGIVTFGFVRLVGRWSDLYGRRRIFAIVATLSMLGMLVTTHLPRVPVWVAVLSASFFIPMLSGRFVPAMAILTSAATPRLRGAFMSLNAAFQQAASGSAAFLASLIVGRSPAGELTHYGTVGWIAVAATIATIFLSRRVRAAPQPPPRPEPPA